MKSKDNLLMELLSKINFKLDKKIGEGRFSIVKLGIHSLTKEPVAIKILDKTKIATLEDKERINREIKIMKKINHFNITKLYSVIETKYIIYLVQEYVQGKELNDYLYTKGKLSEIEACKFFHQIISGLSYLHHCGIVHRDFKPENILLTNDNKILKIIDFGLGNTYEKGQLLKTGCGSPCYIPPEMLKEMGYNGEETDIWSAGIILYLMLCGTLPFYEEDNQLLYQKIIKGEYTIPKYLSEEAKDIIKQILEVDPKKRINFEKIKKHPWFNIINTKYMMFKGIDVDIDIMPIDEDILNEMEKYGINKIEIRYHLLNNYHNKITTLYNILLKKKIEQGKKSIADMNSEIYNIYMNDPKNRIKYYPNFDILLKNRIGNNGSIVKSLPHWSENEYEKNNENIIIGDSGSVMERLIKAGKFEYDEEKMCLNKVNIYNNNIKVKDNSNDDEDFKFKTISSIKTGTKRTYKKVKEENNKLNTNIKNNNYYKYENEKNKETNNAWKIKKVKTDIRKNKKEEEEDWYKEMEKIIDEENKIIMKNKNNSGNKNRNKNNQIIRPTKTSRFSNHINSMNMNKKEDVKISSFLLDKDKKNNKKEKYSSALSNKISNIRLRKFTKPNNNSIINKKNILSKTVYIDNNNKSEKIIKKDIKAIKNMKIDETKKLKKRQKSTDKNEKNKSNKNRWNDEEIFAINNNKRRNQSFYKRTKKINI
jgi:5'-AMP-activated protein kinase catalytic alpha subunit